MVGIPTKRIPWVVVSTLVAVLMLLPFFFLLSSTFGEETSNQWSILDSPGLTEWISNSIGLILGVGGLTCVLGVSLALLVTNYQFPGARFFRWALLMPLAIPSYIAAYVFHGIFEYTGPLHQLSMTFSDGWYLNIMNPWGLVIVLSLVLYPYVFSTTRVALQSRFASYYESARSLGLSSTQRFFKVLLPLLSPAIAGGVFLVMMEVLNDYGAMKYFGVPTFTTAIFTQWFSLGDKNGAIQLALMLFAIVGVLAVLESRFHRKHRVTESHRSRSSPPTVLSGWKSSLASAFCGFIFFIAFVAPVGYLLWLFSFAKRSRAVSEWFGLTTNSLITGIAGALTVLLLVLITQFVRQLVRGRFTFWIGKSISMGYAIPGAIIAIGVSAVAISFDRAFFDGLTLQGSILMLVFAYAVRFSGVAYQPLNAEAEKRSGRLFEAGRSLGKNSWALLKDLFIPLSRKGVLIAASLVAIDILKELPLTLILRPFNFDTLATKAFEYADDELLYQAALPSLSVILVGLIPVLLLNRLMRKP